MGGGDREPGEPGHLRKRVGVIGIHTLGGRVAVGAGQDAHLLDQFEQVLALLADQALGKQAAEAPHVGQQGGAEFGVHACFPSPCDGCRKSPQVLEGHPLRGAAPLPGQVCCSRSGMHIGD
jgi:hypothetical protein